ncbi:FG-GAP-like repeat-containing protein [Singulisphaera rosea]
MISISDASVAEGDSGSTLMNFTVTRTGDLGPLVEVAYETSDGTAKSGTDYNPTSGTVIIPAGSATATISVPVLGNQFLQSDRTFTVNLTSVVGVTPATFSDKVDFATSNLPLSVAIGDLNGDGKPDLAVATTVYDRVSVLMNTTAPGATTPTFAPKVDFAAGSGQNAFSVAIEDLNGDGKPDLAVANDRAGTAAVLLNTTTPGSMTPTFTPYTEFATGAGPTAVVIGDLNADGKPDLVVANVGSTRVSVLLNTTATGSLTPTFAPKIDFSMGGAPYSVAIGDLNGDGKPDLAVAMPNNDYVSILLNTMDPGATTPTFAPRIDLASPAQAGPDSVAIGDLNADGRPDLVIANVTAGTVSVLLNTTSDEGSTPTFAPKVDYVTGSHPTSVVISDLDGDGKPDLSLVNGNDHSVSIFQNLMTLGATSPSFGAKVDFQTGSTPQSLAVGDLNDDGLPDFAVASFYSNAAQVLLQNPAPIATISGASATGTILDDDAPAYFSIVSPDGQSAPVNSAFDTTFKVSMINSAGHPIQGASVTFTAPSSGASGTFAGGVASVTVLTDVDGVATASAFTANDVAGSYKLTVTCPEAQTPVIFSLTNTKFSPVFSGLNPAGIVYGTATTTLSGHLAAGTNIPAGSTVTVTIDSVQANASIDADGAFQVEFDTSKIPYSATPYSVTYAFGETVAYKAASDSSTTVTVESRPLVIYANPRVKTYGDAVTFSGTEFLAAGLVNSDVINSVKLISAGTSATADVSSTGTVAGPPYVIVISDAEGTGLSNYTISYVSSGLTVLPMHIRGVFTASAKSYDGTTDATVLTESTEGDRGGVSLVGGTANFGDAGVGTGKVVALLGATLSGANAADYILDSVSPARADIWAASSTVQLTGTSTDSTYGQAVTFVANVDGGGSGTVTFLDGDSPLGTVPVSGSTPTMFSTADLAVGEHFIVASYSGDANHAASRSATFSEIVNQATTTTTLTTSDSPGGRGRTMTLVASVTGGATGVVIFSDGNSILGTGVISGSTATLLMRKPRMAGGHSLVASYGGDTNHLGSVSTPLRTSITSFTRRLRPALGLMHHGFLGSRISHVVARPVHRLTLDRHVR